MNLLLQCSKRRTVAATSIAGPCACRQHVRPGGLGAAGASGIWQLDAAPAATGEGVAGDDNDVLIQSCIRSHAIFMCLLHVKYHEPVHSVLCSSMKCFRDGGDSQRATPSLLRSLHKRIIMHSALRSRSGCPAGRAVAGRRALQLRAAPSTATPSTHSQQADFEAFVDYVLETQRSILQSAEQLEGPSGRKFVQDRWDRDPGNPNAGEVVLSHASAWTGAGWFDAWSHACMCSCRLWHHCCA